MATKQLVGYSSATFRVAVVNLEIIRSRALPVGTLSNFNYLPFPALVWYSTLSTFFRVIIARNVYTISF